MAKKKMRLYPEYLPYVAASAFIAFELLLAVALLFPPRAGQAIDFVSRFTPKPEWYFLWLYQLLRYFPGRWTFFGTVIMPLVFISLLVFIPYMDKDGRGRKIAVVAGLFLLASAVTLSILSVFNL